MSKLLFIRSYLLIVLLILLVGLGLDKVLSYYTQQENISTEKSLLKGSFSYIEMVLKENQKSIPVVWSQSQRAIQTELGYPVSLYQLSDFSSQEQLENSLRSGEIVVMASKNDGIDYYRQLQNTDYIIALSPLHNQGDPLLTDFMIIAIYHLLVAGALFLWLWPLSQDLHELRKAAITFGAEHFTTRIKVRKNSSIAPVANAFNFMAQRIEDLVIAHKDLTHAVSHELKTPLSRFKFSLEIISTHDDAAQRYQYLQAMKQDVRELDDLIEEMLSYAKLNAENLKLHLKKVNAKHWLQDIIAQYDQQNIDIHLDFLMQPPDADKQIIIDSHLMSRAINNLIRNGLRHAQSQINISLEIINDQIKLRIDDDGEGIPTQFIEHVFQPFTRLDASRDRQSGGYGLGLAIVQKIIQQHGGSIVADKSALGGAGFQLNWPAIKSLSSMG